MIGPGMHRDPRYRGKLGIPEEVLNTPQKTAQWWLVAAVAMLVVLPFGLWGFVYRGGNAAMGLYFALVLVAGLNAWMLRNDINEDLPYLAASIVSGVAGLGAFAFLGPAKAFMQGQLVAGAISVAIMLIMLNVIFRSWQSLLVIGVFTEQKRRPETVASKRPEKTPPPLPPPAGPSRRP